MVLLQVDVVKFGLVGGVAALFAHVHFRAALLVRVLVLDAVNLQRVGFEGTTLREGFLAMIALVRANS